MSRGSTSHVPTHTCWPVTPHFALKLPLDRELFSHRIVTNRFKKRSKFWKHVKYLVSSVGETWLHHDKIPPKYSAHNTAFWAYIKLANVQCTLRKPCQVSRLKRAWKANFIFYLSTCGERKRESQLANQKPIRESSTNKNKNGKHVMGWRTNEHQQRISRDFIGQLNCLRGKLWVGERATSCPSRQW